MKVEMARLTSENHQLEREKKEEHFKNGEDVTKLEKQYKDIISRSQEQNS